MTPAPPRRRRPVALVGFRASGKSTLGRALASDWHCEFLDLDAVIEEVAAKSVGRVFAEDGEPRFRELEAAALRRVLRRSGIVLATGGGVVELAQNRTLLRQRAETVYLCLPAETLIARLQTGPDRPPLTDLSPDEEVRQVLARRDVWYRQVSEHVVEVQPDEPIEATRQRLFECLSHP